MSDYKSDTFKPKQRTYEITVRNTINAVPSVEYKEEIVIMEGDVVKVQERIELPLVAEIPDMSIMIEKYNPIDGTVIGTMPLSDAYVALYSSYRHFANLRDAGGI